MSCYINRLLQSKDCPALVGRVVQDCGNRRLVVSFGDLGELEVDVDECAPVVPSPRDCPKPRLVRINGERIP